MFTYHTIKYIYGIDFTYLDATISVFELIVFTDLAIATCIQLQEATFCIQAASKNRNNCCDLLPKGTIIYLNLLYNYIYCNNISTKGATILLSLDFTAT